MAATTTLEAEFLQDHRVLTQGLHALRDALETGDLDGARRIAEDLDRDAGAHIEFEERYFYPRLVPLLGEEFVRQLYREHDAGRNAIRELESGQAHGLEDAHRLPLIGDVEIAAEHALTCGTLTSHLAELPEEERDEMLERLRECRARQRRWTEIDIRDRPTR